MAQPVNIIIPAWNQVAYSRQCIQTLLANTPEGAYRLILVNNGSTDETPAFFDSVPNASVIHFPENRGFAAAVNAGMRLVESGHVLLLNNDTLLPPGWLERLQAPLDEMPDAGLVGPVSNTVSGSQQIETPPLTTWEEIISFAHARAAEYAGRRRETARLVGFCLLIRDRAFQDIGLFDERYGIGNYEDDDYCLRAIRAGWRLVIAEDAFVFHYGGRTFLALDPEMKSYRQLLDRNRSLFESKFQPSPHERLDEALRARRLAEAASQSLAGGNLKAAIKNGLDALNHWRFELLAWDVLAQAMEHLGEHERAALLRQQAQNACRAMENSGPPSSSEGNSHDGTDSNCPL